MADTDMKQHPGVAAMTGSGWRARRARKRFFSKLFAHLVLIAGAVIFTFPLVWLVSTSLKPDTQIFKVPPELIPRPIMWENYVDMWTYFPFLQFLKNTLVIVVLSMAGVLISAPLVAYAFAKLKWPGRDFLFFILLGTMMLPGQVTMIPLYILFTNWGWVDTFLPLWVPAWFGGGAFNIFLIRQFLMTIPHEMEESALLDGANHLTIYTRIMLPLIQPVLTTVAIFQFMGAWNDFMGPLIYINDQTKYTLSLGLRLFQQQTSASTTEFGMMMAATTVMVIPVIVFFFLGQRRFIEGVVLTGMKA
ncbi:carbohydrate ABC transporter permease [Mahella australiensis]|uniref:Carbohydrate ABC transporter membrane protein 2, CUT1 family n=1 Tax=Mahella australiensis (strain DSM 15567 / CIP 107919 / 50-1 BON) TaxID=697281 RepID=F4A328_MAHA5|nr:carbohydrate ABC transporter permease [Mahella australiensis]AEE95243.1 carbohydrate ABC transporter membrane protein 2, CUT1 family [Mahella australiensis 50-1 BON]